MGMLGGFVVWIIGWDVCVTVGGWWLPWWSFFFFFFFLLLPFPLQRCAPFEVESDFV